MPLPPSLTRQNAFYLEDDQTNTPLDPMCAMCYEHAATVNDKLIRPCRCNMETGRALYAHESCFKNWLITNQYPKRCTRCKAKYTIIVYPPFNKKKCILLLTVILVILLYFFLHLRHCTTIQVLTKDELLNTDFGNNHHTLKNVPDYLLTPASIKRTT